MTIVGHRYVTDSESAIAARAEGSVGDITHLASARGCYSVILTHRSGISAYSDPVGQFPLFWARTDDQVLVGPSAAAIAAEIDGRVDLVSLAARIACSDTPDLFADRTMYQHVHRVPEGTVLQVDAHGARQFEHHRVRVDPGASVADTAELLRDRLLYSVRARLDSTNQLSTDFSGGFDSTSLAFLAASHGKQVLALTSAGTSADSDDVKRACSHALLSRALTHRMVTASVADLPFQDLVPASEEPYATPMFLGPLRARLAAAKDAGADLHLVGEGGDVMLGAPPAYLADLARRGDLTTLWRHCIAWARLRNRSPLRLFRRAMALGMTSRRQALLSLARDLEHGRPADTPFWEDDWLCHWRRPRADWLTTRVRLQLAGHIRDAADRAPDVDSIGDQITLSWLRSQTMTQRAVHDAGQEFGISVHAPFLDSDVVRACLSLSARHRVDPTVYKPVLRNALADVVPRAVLSHPAKGDYTGETYQGVRRAAPTLRQLFTESIAADHGLIEPRPVLAAIEGAVQGLPTPWGSLAQIIAVELWFRDLQDKGVSV